MQKMYKNVKIPTYYELIASNARPADSDKSPDVFYEVEGINIKLMPLDDFINLKNTAGIAEVNKYIEDTIVDFIDNYLDSVKVTTDAVKMFEDDVNNDPNKVFKDLINAHLNEKGEIVNVNITENTENDQEGNEEERGSETEANIEEAWQELPERQDESGSESSGGEKSSEDQQAGNDDHTSEDGFINPKRTTDSTGLKKLTDQEIDTLVDYAEKVNENNEEIKTIRNLPSNNGVEERNPEDITEENEKKSMMVSIDPNTGENRIIGDVGEKDEIEDSETFEEMCERIENSDIDLESTTTRPISDEEATKIIDDPNTKDIFSTISNSDDLDGINPETLTKLISVANRRINKEKFSVYNEMPEEIKNMIDTYAAGAGISPVDKRYKMMKNSVAEALLDEFISNINLNRIHSDFNAEIENIFDKASKEISEDIIGYSNEKIAKYKEAADKMEDPEKKEKLLKVLDRIQEAYDLSELKEFAKSCKIKPFDLEKPKKFFDHFSQKYKSSNYNIYSIEMCRPILYRNINAIYTEDGAEESAISDKDINAFFICFCKQTTNMKSDEVLDHSYMYYVIYNIVLSDLNKSENTKHISDTFLANVYEVIQNLRERNSNIL